jgi:hypothetical protein
MHEAHLLVELDIFHDLETQSEVSKVNVDSQKTNDAEVAKHTVKWTLSIFTNNLTDDAR